VSNEAQIPEKSPSYRSGVAARLAGVPVETLRVWERRYGVVSPRLSPSGQRLYSTDEIRRLGLIKQLVDMGHPIGVIARLPTDALLAMRATSSPLAVNREFRADRPAPRLVLIGPVISRLRMEARAGGLDIAGRCTDVAAIRDGLAGVSADVVVMELPTLQPAALGLVATAKEAVGAEQAIVLYRFGPSAVIRQLRLAGHAVARAPSDASEIETLCTTLLRSGRAALQFTEVVDAAQAEPTPPRFDEASLLELASASTTVYCECPRHVVDLLLSLNSFENYSAECGNRDAADAELHRDLQRTAGRARVLLEEALIRVAKAEGLRLPASKTIQ